jgi:hypothetical protein
LSVGGVLGGLFCAIIAPLAFDWTYEHPILLVAAAFMLKCSSPFARWVDLWDGSSISRLITTVGVPLLLCLPIIAGFGYEKAVLLAAWTIAIFSIGNRWLFVTSLIAIMLTSGGLDRIQASLEPGRLSRSFFGVYAVADENGARVISHGTTVHGMQNTGSAAREVMPTTYYAPQSGIGLALSSADTVVGASARLGIVGLGTGTLACYARPGQQWLFYEIDPLVVRIARDPRRFTFLSRCLPNVPVVVGDARLSLAAAPPNSADILVIDAFSSDSIPIHLLTHQAFEVYRRHLSPTGLLMVHISNRHLDLHKVLAAEIKAGAWHASLRKYRPGKSEQALNYLPSDWVALSRSPMTIAALPGSWEAVPSSTLQPWSDDHASVLPILK